jgi:hypothetical protein
VTGITKGTGCGEEMREAERLRVDKRRREENDRDRDSRQG